MTGQDWEKHTALRSVKDYNVKNLKRKRIFLKSVFIWVAFLQSSEMSDQWLKPLSRGNRGQRATQVAVLPYKTLHRCPNKQTEILYCVACTNIYISLHCLFNKANKSPSLLPSSAVFFFLSCWKKSSFTLAELLKNSSRCRLRFFIAQCLSEGMHRQASVVCTPCFHLFGKKNVSAYVSTQS